MSLDINCLTPFRSTTHRHNLKNYLRFNSTTKKKQLKTPALSRNISTERSLLRNQFYQFLFVFSLSFFLESTIFTFQLFYQLSKLRLQRWRVNGRKRNTKDTLPYEIFVLVFWKARREVFSRDIYLKYGALDTDFSVKRWGEIQWDQSKWILRMKKGLFAIVGYLSFERFIWWWWSWGLKI